MKNCSPIESIALFMEGSRRKNYLKLYFSKILRSIHILYTRENQAGLQINLLFTKLSKKIFQEDNTENYCQT